MVFRNLSASIASKIAAPFREHRPAGHSRRPANAPATVARTVPAGDIMRGAVKSDLTLPDHILCRPCVIHKQARPVMAREARLLNRRMAGCGFQAGGYRVLRIIDTYANTASGSTISIHTGPTTKSSRSPSMCLEARTLCCLPPTIRQKLASIIFNCG